MYKSSNTNLAAVAGLAVEKMKSFISDDDWANAVYEQRKYSDESHDYHGCFAPDDYCDANHFVSEAYADFHNVSPDDLRFDEEDFATMSEVINLIISSIESGVTQ